MTSFKDTSSLLPGPASHTSRLPLLLDITMNVTQIIVVLVAIIVAVLSILSRAEPLTVILRTAVAILAVGIPGFILNFLLGKFYVQATLNELLTAQAASSKPDEQTERAGIDLETSA